ncbi:FAD-dependent oxidoreductase [Larsenimonas rhizosphaerae]|uniref:FAD-dependent oxidoreductase n=1 Tax=Larsenimonas rhizosphaerae TaxID=2944682 RepID=UPI002034222F|nr:FAD-dependent oxidoreductase [Larsenimonas rhizosphaerae]MCM2130515.1 FAD-dependent oxidoreductase [Larsenimonas rhizosphaerae]
MDTSNYVDIAIVGGGMTGAAMALALSDTGLSVCVIEPRPPASAEAGTPPDLRISSLNQANCDFLDRLGAFDAMDASRIHPFTRLAVWEDLAGTTLPGARSRWNRTIFDASEIKADRLGVMVENQVIQSALWSCFDDIDTLSCLTPARLERLTLGEDSVRLTLDCDGVPHDLEAGLVIGAEGARSAVREHAGISIDTRPYEHKAMIVNVQTAAPTLDMTWQAFTPSGPHALLPLFAPADQPDKAWASLIWYDAPARIDALQALSFEALQTEIEQTFPDELPPIDHISGVGSFPLVRQHAERYVQDRVALIGDAAHVINPLAGQGVNLGFQDVEALSRVIHDALAEGRPWWRQHVLLEYAMKRKWANQLMMSTMDAFYHGFRHQGLPFKLVRNAGLALAGHAGFGRRRVMAYAMGLSHP